MAFSAGTFITGRRSHVTIGMFDKRLSEKALRVMECFAMLVVAFTCIALVYYSYPWLLKTIRPKSSALADAAALGSVLLPTMKKNGYDPHFAAAITAASSTMGPIMPPSIAAVLYAVLSGTSVAAPFFASVVPALMIIASVGALFSYIMAREGIPQQAAALLTSITANPLLFLLLLNIFLLLVGMVLEPASALLVTVPIFYPIAQTYEIDPIHLGVVVIFNLTLGLMTPPVCLVLQMQSQIGNLDFGKVLMATLPMLGILFAVLLIVTYMPGVVLALPRFLGM